VFREGKNFIDETANEYSEGRLVVAAFHSLTKRGRARWLVLCRPCNVTFVVEGSNLRRGTTTRCPVCSRARRLATLKEILKMQREVIDEIGNVYGRLTVISFEEVRNVGKCRYAFWLCQCSCGSPLKAISGAALRKGNTKSCGCLRQDRSAENILVNRENSPAVIKGRSAANKENQNGKAS
jgi:hypothetical protein